VVLSEIPLDQYFQKVAIALSSGSGIDVFDVDCPLVASYGYQGALLPLDKYYTKENADDFIKSEREIATYKGKMISAPMSSTSVGLFVNTDLFKAAGLRSQHRPQGAADLGPGGRSGQKVQVDKGGNRSRIPGLRHPAV